MVTDRSASSDIKVADRIRRISQAIDCANPAVIESLKNFAACPPTLADEPSSRQKYRTFQDFSKFFTEAYSKVG